MSRRASATPYAKALFEVALGQGKVESVLHELETFCRLVAEHADLGRVLTHPAVPARAKREIVERLSAEIGASVPVRKLLVLIADRDRLVIVPELAKAYHARVMQHLRIVEAEVTTAVPLSAAQEDALARGLERATGRQVRLATSVKPSIMGGVVARMGSLVFDGSVTRQLERLRRQLAAES